MGTDRHQRVKQIFLEACALDEASRASFVREACGDDESLRSEVQSLLAHHRDNTIFPNSADETRLQRRSAGSRSRSRGTTGSFRRLVLGWTDHLGFAGQLVLCAIFTMLMVFGLAWWSQRQTDRLLRRSTEASLVKLSETADDLVKHWLDSERRSVDAMQAVPAFRVALNAAVNATAPDAGAAPVPRPDLDRMVAAYGGPEAVYVVLNRVGKVTAFGGNPDFRWESAAKLRGVRPREIEPGKRWASDVLLPHRCHAYAGDDWFGLKKPMVGVLAPVVIDAGSLYGVFFVASPGRLEALNGALRSFRVAGSGECFLCSADGRMLNESRFRDELISSGALPEGATTSVLMPLHEPGVNFMDGERSSVPYQTRPRPSAVAAIQAGGSGVNIEGFPDYRGVRVVAAWRRNDDYDYGLVVKADYDEAFAALKPLEWFAVVRLVLIAAAIAILIWSWIAAAAMRRRLRSVVQIGPYVLEGLIGEGGMGRVYRARHVLLKRATAVKVIKSELVSERTIGWFEREVEVAGKLKHPNTVEIYDFGRSDHGQFYCAMEFLNGLNLAQVAAMEGPLPPERVIHIMRYAAHSLREAHRRGMVHRDVKPQNIMLCVLGGEADVVKVLDFGLAKQHDSATDRTDTKMLAGTPLYLAPERLKPPFKADARSDIYSLGMTIYKLLAGRDVFTGDSDLEVFHQTLNVAVVRPSSLVPHPIPAEFEDLILRCLEKDPASRPLSMGEVVALLDRLTLEYPWMPKEAHSWWQANSQRVRTLFPMWDPDEQLEWESTFAPAT